MTTKTVYLASDHAGFSVKALLAEKTIQISLEICDLGPTSSMMPFCVAARWVGYPHAVRIIVSRFHQYLFRRSDWPRHRSY